MKNIITLIICFYFLTLLQTSFFSYLPSTHFFNFILVAVFLINFFEAQKKNSGLFSAFFGGFFLDIFSENFIGFWILILLVIAIFIKFIFKKYVRFPILQQF